MFKAKIVQAKHDTRMDQSGYCLCFVSVLHFDVYFPSMSHDQALSGVIHSPGLGGRHSSGPRSHVAVSTLGLGAPPWDVLSVAGAEESNTLTNIRMNRCILLDPY